MNIQNTKYPLPDEVQLQELISSRELNILWNLSDAEDGDAEEMIRAIVLFQIEQKDKVRLRIICRSDEQSMKKQWELEQLIRKYCVSDLVIPVKDPDDSRLLALYLGSDMMPALPDMENSAACRMAEQLGLPLLRTHRTGRLTVSWLIVPLKAPWLAAAFLAWSRHPEVARSQRQIGYAHSKNEAGQTSAV